MNHWLMKSEPDVFGIEHLKAKPKGTAPWDGVRGYQARNMLRDDMQVGDQAFFYHSSCAVPGIAGVIEITRAGYPDFTAWDPDSIHYDPKSSADKPIWYMVDVRFLNQFPRIITLQELKQHKPLRDMRLLQRGTRLSIMPVTKHEWDYIIKLEKS
jgi:predicted RNA-binding protein with PUA-like domain